MDSTFRQYKVYADILGVPFALKRPLMGGQTRRFLVISVSISLQTLEMKPVLLGIRRYEVRFQLSSDPKCLVLDLSLD